MSAKRSTLGVWPLGAFVEGELVVALTFGQVLELLYRLVWEALVPQPRGFLDALRYGSFRLILAIRWIFESREAI